MEDNERLHFMRIREKRNSDFIDPNADMVKVFNETVADVLGTMELTHDTRADELRSLLFAANTKALEDPEPVAQQVDDIIQALKAYAEKEPVKFNFFTGMLFRSLLIQHIMLLRRDGASTSQERASMRKSALSMAVMADLGKDAYIKAIGDYASWDVLKADEEADAVAEYMRLPHIKARAMELVGATPNMSWEQVSELCDKYFMAGKGTDADKVAVALAYPGMKASASEVTITDGDESVSKGKIITTP